MHGTSCPARAGVYSHRQPHAPAIHHGSISRPVAHRDPLCALSHSDDSPEDGLARLGAADTEGGMAGHTVLGSGVREGLIPPSALTQP